MYIYVGIRARHSHQLVTIYCVHFSVLNTGGLVLGAAELLTHESLMPPCTVVHVHMRHASSFVFSRWGLIILIQPSTAHLA